MNITQFTMEEVRCFSDRQTLEIRPLTFLVGENSTGKTTALGCFHVLANYLRDNRLDFNADPYSMGIFKDVVRNSRPKAKTFKLGFTTEIAEWIVEFAEKTGAIEPTVSSAKLKFSDGEIVFKIRDGSAERQNRLAAFEKKHNCYEINYGHEGFDLFLERPNFCLLGSRSVRFLKGDSKGKTALANFLKTHENSERPLNRPWDIGSHLSVFSTSPIRSRPKRTYDPTKEFNDPEGGDVPMFLMRVRATQQKRWEKLKTQLVEFGKSSGLFQNIEIKNFGRSLGGPFQLRFKVKGPSANIVDVGYGVSQILPILVHILNSDIDEMTYFLLQQPEVHLHPRVQAELSSLMVKLANDSNRSFIVETHSDYMIDRARIEIRRGNIKPEDVSLIYFEPKGNILKGHNISFDKMANMEGVPPHFREFFLKESNRLMGFED